MRKFLFKSVIIVILFLMVFSTPVNSVTIKDLDEEKNFFKITKKDGRFFFLDPNDQLFYSTGMGSISATKGHSPALGYSEYHKNILEKYGNEEQWANITHKRLTDWGFNSLGGSGRYIRDTNMNYTVHLGLACDDWITGEIADYFSNEWINKVDNKCKNKIVNVSNDTKLIGYFLDNEIHWGSDWRSLLDIFDIYMKCDSDSPGKIRLVDFLKHRYENNISKFNLAWRTNLNDFDEIFHKKILGIWPYTIEARNDHNDFLYVVSEQFFRVCYEKIRKYDKNHLILGARFQSYMTPRKVVEACKGYVDVVSVNHYPSRLVLRPIWFIFQDIIGFARPTKNLEEFYKLTDKPVLISEIYFRAKDSGLPNTKPSNIFMPVYRTQRGRSIAAEYVLKNFIKEPYSVGYHWFGYSDQPKTGRFDGENSNNGLVDVNDEPYDFLIKRLTKVNRYAESFTINN